MQQFQHAVKAHSLRLAHGRNRFLNLRMSLSTKRNEISDDLRKRGEKKRGKIERRTFV